MPTLREIVAEQQAQINAGRTKPNNLGDQLQNLEGPALAAALAYGTAGLGNAALANFGGDVAAAGPVTATGAGATAPGIGLGAELAKDFAPNAGNVLSALKAGADVASTPNATPSQAIGAGIAQGIEQPMKTLAKDRIAGIAKANNLPIKGIDKDGNPIYERIDEFTQALKAAQAKKVIGETVSSDTTQKLKESQINKNNKYQPGGTNKVIPTLEEKKKAVQLYQVDNPSFAGTAAQIMFDQLKDADKQVYYKAAREGSSAKVSVGNPDPLGILK